MNVLDSDVQESMIMYMSESTTYYVGSEPLEFIETANKRGRAWFRHTDGREREYRIADLPTAPRQTRNLKMRVDTSRGTDGAR